MGFTEINTDNEDQIWNTVTSFYIIHNGELCQVTSLSPVSFLRKIAFKMKQIELGKQFIQENSILNVTTLCWASLVAQRKESAFNAGDMVGKTRWRKKWQPTPVFLPGEFHGQRNLVGYSPRGQKESDTTQKLNNNNNDSMPGQTY